MKKNILIIILLFIVQLIKSQSFDMSSNWTIIATNIFDDTFHVISSYKVYGDTLINGIDYNKVFNNNKFICALRESEDNKIYAYFPDIQKDLLIYDFNWIEGKELKYQPYEENGKYQTYTTISKIDSIRLLDNNYYKCLKSDNEIFCIQGIGDIRGFFSFIFPTPSNGSQTAVLCFFRGEQLIYCNANYNNCYGTFVDNKKISDKNIKVYPTPSNGIITIELMGNNLIEADSFYIFNENGELVKSYRVDGKKLVYVNQLTRGLYIYIITTQKGQKISGKIMINQ